jgi:HK97 family phage major capsid protein
MELDIKQFAKEIRDELLPELKAAVEQEISEKTKNNGQVSPETMERIVRIEQKFDQLEAMVERPEMENKRAPKIHSPGTVWTESEEFKAWQKKGFISEPPRRVLIGAAFAPTERKDAITSGSMAGSTTYVVPLQRIDGMIGLPMQELRVRDLIPTRPVTAPNADWIRQTTRTNLASPQVEGSAKSESTYAWEAVSTPMRTIAHFVQVTTQALADIPWLRNEIDMELMYGLKLKEESELLLGDGTGQHIDGIIPQATAYDTGLNASGDTKLDKLRHAIYQARLALYPVDGIVLNPKDLHDIDLIKTNEGTTANQGMYVVGDPKAGPMMTFIWGKRVVESDSIPVGDFLVGAFGMGAMLFDRMQAVIDVSYEHGTNFIENEATVRCEERIGLGVRRPAAFVEGSF